MVAYKYEALAKL